MTKTLELTHFERTQQIQDISDDLSRMVPAFRHALDQLKEQVIKDQNQLFSFENHATHIQQRLLGVKERQRGKIKVCHQLESKWYDVCDPTALALLCTGTPSQEEALGHIEQLSWILSDYDKIATALAHTIPGLKGPGLRVPRHQTICDTQDSQSLLLTNTNYPIPGCSAVVGTPPDIHSGHEVASDLHQTQDSQSLLLTDTSHSIPWCSALVGTSPEIHSGNRLVRDLHQTTCNTKDSQSLMLTDTSYWIAGCSAVVGTSPDIHSGNRLVRDLHQTTCNTKDSQHKRLTISNVDRHELLDRKV